ncbi:MAG: Hsp20/alpha crystallin family protein [Gammaproteobacteria bacterium]|nr:Hsp20/alpha crystallin family protein [Gammaproteobacteria bacterium]
MNLVPRRSLFDLDDLFDAWSPFRGDADRAAWTPRVDVKDKQDCYEITAELPGVKKEDLHVTLRNGVLTIEAETRQDDKEEKDGKLIRQERRYGKLTRSFAVGAEVKESDISASFENGVLTLTAPKHEPKAPEARRIEVR